MLYIADDRGKFYKVMDATGRLGVSFYGQESSPRLSEALCYFAALIMRDTSE